MLITQSCAILILYFIHLFFSEEATVLHQKRPVILDARLAKTASMVRPNAIFADVGCDHGYLAIELMRQGACHGYACDINAGPLETAKRNIEAAGFTQQIQTVLTDGLNGLDNCGLTDITIAGIGGEVITEILKKAEFLKKDSTRLVLQPQSREYILRSFLAENGFSVLSEEAVRSGRYVYTVITADYTGECRKLSMQEAFAGLLPSNHTAAAAEKLWRTAQFLQNTAEGIKRKGDIQQALMMAETAEQLFAISHKLSNFQE